HLIGALDPWLEVLEQSAHAREEVRYLRERRHAGGLLEPAEQKTGRAIHGAQRRPAGREVGLHEPLDDLAIEEVPDPPGRLEEIEGMARRGGVHDDEIVAAALGEHAQLLDRHVLLRAGEGPREVLVEAVGEDTITRLGRRVALDERVPGPLL